MLEVPKMLAKADFCHYYIMLVEASQYTKKCANHLLFRMHVTDTTSMRRAAIIAQSSIAILLVTTLPIILNVTKRHAIEYDAIV
jgi:hypothetical protein